MFLVPVLGLDKSVISDHNYLNGYSDLKDKILEYEPHVIYLLFKPKNRETFQDFVEGQYEMGQSILEDFDLDDDFVVLVYKLNEELDRDYHLIKLGNYSKTSEEFQSLFPETISDDRKGMLTKRKTLQKMVFDKEKSLFKYWQNNIGRPLLNEDMEVWYSFDTRKETLNLEEIIETLKND